MKIHSRARGARLGQHFLTNPKVAFDVAHAAGIYKGDTVLEIGPGKGILTAEILKLGAHVVAIEKDPVMVVILKERFAKEIAEKKLTLLEADARDVLKTPQEILGGTYKVAANIPYYITGELLRLCLTSKYPPTSLAFLVQKEVAVRIVRSKKESILSLSIKVFGDPKYVKTVPRGNFNPPPSVDSAILSVSDISRKNFTNVSEKDFFAVVKAGFAQKRKTLGGNLKRAFGERGLLALKRLDISSQVRAEDVPLESWLQIAQRI